jgi:hypothetical protein
MRILRFAALIGAIAVPAHAFAWGAIAVDDKDGQSAADVGYGYVTGENSEEAARRGAMRECRKSNKTCKVMITFESCGSYAVSGRRWGTGEGVTEGAARRQALLNCGNAACRPVISECN